MNKYLFGEIIVKILSWLSSQADKKFVKVAWCVHHLWFEKVFTQQYVSLLLPSVID